MGAAHADFNFLDGFLSGPLVGLLCNRSPLSRFQLVAVATLWVSALIRRCQDPEVRDYEHVLRPCVTDIGRVVVICVF